MKSLHMENTMNTLLLITSGEDAHATKAEDILKKRKVPYFRLDTERFPQHVSIDIRCINGKLGGSIADGHRRIQLSEIKSAWYRKPQLPEISSDVQNTSHRDFALQESQTALLWLYQALADRRWLNHPDDIHRASSKVRQLAIASQVGFITPPTLITNIPATVMEFVSDVQADLAIKTLGPHAYAVRQTNKTEIRGLYTKRINKKDLQNVDSVRYCPSFLQQYIEKDIELRVTVVHDKVFSCAIHSQTREETSQDWHHPDHVYDLKHEPCTLPGQISDACVRFLQKFNLRFGAFDFIRTTSGQYVFVECNPNGQWLWIEDLTNLRITEAIISLFKREMK